MPLSPDFRTRSLHWLDTAPDDETVVVARVGADTALLMQTRSPTAHGLVAIARALLSQASDELGYDDASEADVELLGLVEEALSALPKDGDEGEVPR